MPPYRCIAQGKAGWFDFNDPTPAVGTDGATVCVGVYLETIDNQSGIRGCVIAHVDSNQVPIPNDPANARFQSVVNDVQNVKLGLLLPAGHQGVPGTLYLTGNSDRGLANAIATGFRNVIGGGAATISPTAEGYGIKVVGGAPQYPPTWFIGNGDVYFHFNPTKVEGTQAWTNDF